MASTSTAPPPTPPSSPAPDDSVNWLEMPPELMSMILQKLGVVEILHNAQKVCTNWRIICKDPAMWKVINIPESVVDRDMDVDLENLTRQAVNRSCGELIEISLEYFCTDELLNHISQCSSMLKRLSLSNCYNMSSTGLSNAVKNLPQLDQLHLYYTTLYVEDIELIGRNCPQLKSFKMNKKFTRFHIECDSDALAIANSMPELRHLQLFGNRMTNEGLQAILQNCPHLESLDVRRCFNLDLGGDLGKLCMEQIKDVKRPNDSTENCGFDPRVHGDDFDDIYSSGYSDADVGDFSGDDFYADYDLSGGSVNSDDYYSDYYDQSGYYSYIDYDDR